MPEIRVLLADDHPIVRQGIRILLEKAPDIIVVGETGNGVEALHLVKELSPDVLILDIEMPGLNGVEIIRQLKRMGSTVRVLVLSAYEDRQHIQNILTSGASGYLGKEEAPEVIIQAVRGVGRGEKGWLSRNVTTLMAKWVEEEITPKTPLSSREMEVLRALVQGKTNREIGLSLGIGEKTVEKHLEGIYTKLGVASRVEAAVYAVQHGWF
jgi:DNA-binding NarL/FixJ family response regulator